MTDNEIIKACKNCLHYEACKGTYYSAKGDEDILHDFDGEMYANSGCEDFEDKDLINRQKANAEGLTNAVKYLNEQVSSAKTEAIKEFAERLKLKVDIDLCEAIECSDYLYNLPKLIDNLVKEMVGE